eukprot:TRINITY_DN7584_c0_g1_i1.p1 TRINITY_DN7584_c0_g1~~TRINITY_DN7584_c0_g1_i1.p1  ORF type:complete len:1143 (-),score=332.48 TRINITY_DN7584_c0_g1_i1:53-3106(-)
MGYKFVTEDRTDQSPIFSDIRSFVRSHGNLKYNYSDTNLPDIACDPFSPSRVCDEVELVAPKDQSFYFEKKPFLFGKTVVTYPKGSGGYKILCDVIRSKIFGNRGFMVIADGCGWGSRAQRAADIASKAALDYLSRQQVQESITSLDLCRAEIFNAFEQAHKKIIELQGELLPNGKMDLSGCGTTTLACSIIFKVQSTFPTDEWAFVCGSVGDCKAFHLNGLNGKVTDITFGNRRNVRDAKDCGGRLGPWIRKEEPDYRNRATYFWPCIQGDFVILVSDGVHDNLDPETRGLTPKECTKGEFDYESWDDLPNSVIEMVKSTYACSLMEKILLDSKTPKSIVSALIHHAESETRKSREYMEANPNEKEPNDYKSFPGKMDHTSCICFSIGYKLDTFCTASQKGEKEKEKGEKDKRRKNFFNLSKRTASSPPSDRDTLLQLKAELLNTISEIYFFPLLEIKDRIQFNTKIGAKFSQTPDVSGWTYTTYPSFNKEEHKKTVVEPVSSAFSFEASLNRQICILTSTKLVSKGIEISMFANSVFIYEMSKHQIDISNSKQVVTKMLECVDLVHQTLNRKYLDSSEFELNLFCGMGCRLSNLSSSVLSNWMFMCANYGTNQAFHWSHRTKKLKEVNTVNPFTLQDLENSGSKPTKVPPFDLAQLKFFPLYCEDDEKDILIIMTQNLYNNYDPEVMGYSSKIFLDTKTIRNGKSDKVRISSEHRSTTILKAMEKVLQRAPREDADTFVEVLVQGALEITKDRKDFLEGCADMEKGLEDERYQKMRGRMGQGSCAAFRVGSLIDKHNTSKYPLIRSHSEKERDALTIHPLIEGKRKRFRDKSTSEKHRSKGKSKDRMKEDKMRFSDGLVSKTQYYGKEKKRSSEGVDSRRKEDKDKENKDKDSKDKENKDKESKDKDKENKYKDNKDKESKENKDKESKDSNNKDKEKEKEKEEVVQLEINSPHGSTGNLNSSDHDNRNGISSVNSNGDNGHSHSNADNGHSHSHSHSHGHGGTGTPNSNASNGT